VWLFNVDVLADTDKHTFTTRTDTTWTEFKDSVVVRLDAQDFRLNYRFNTNPHIWSNLNYEAECEAMLTLVRQRALGART
jgi:hypothetical protein